MSKEKTIKLTEKEVKIVKDALKDTKEFKRIGMPNHQGEKREQKISEIYDIERIEKKLE
jgi:hypothetical protein